MHFLYTRAFQKRLSYTLNPEAGLPENARELDKNCAATFNSG